MASHDITVIGENDFREGRAKLRFAMTGKGQGFEGRSKLMDIPKAKKEHCPECGGRVLCYYHKDGSFAYNQPLPTYAGLLHPACAACGGIVDKKDNIMATEIAPAKTVPTQVLWQVRAVAPAGIILLHSLATRLYENGSGAVLHLEDLAAKGHLKRGQIRRVVVDMPTGWLVAGSEEELLGYNLKEAR
jgi:hypothetical protein